LKSDADEKLGLLRRYW